MIWRVSSVFCGPLLLLPEPVLHDMMRDGFAARELIKKRPSLLRAGSNYPTVIVGGNMDLNVIEKELRDKRRLKWNWDLHPLSINTVLCMDSHLMLALAFTNYHNRQILLNQFGLIWGDYSRHHHETRLGQLTLPFKLYGAIGRFISPSNPWRSKLIGRYNDIGLYVEDNIKLLSGLLLGGQKDIDICRVSIQLMPFSLNRWIINPQLLFSPFGYTVTVGGGYDSDNKARAGSIYGSFTKSMFTISGQYLFKKDGKQFVKLGAGHVEASVVYPIPMLELPGTLVMGYGWPRKFSAFKENAFFLGGKIAITSYAQLRMGMKIKRKPTYNKDKSTASYDKNYSVGRFITRLEFTL